jgi:hypothetical protein
MRPAKPLEYIARCLQYPRVLDPDALPSHTTRLLVKVRPSLPSPPPRHSHERRQAGFSAAVSISSAFLGRNRHVIGESQSTLTTASTARRCVCACVQVQARHRGNLVRTGKAAQPPQPATPSLEIAAILARPHSSLVRRLRCLPLVMVRARWGQRRCMHACRSRGACSGLHAPVVAYGCG